MSEAVLVVTDLAGVRKGELTKASLDSCEWELNAPGGGAISINPLEAQAELIKVNECEVQVWIDEAYRHCIIPRAIRGNAKKVTYQCEGLLGEFDFRHINNSLMYGSDGPPVVYMEQFQIAWNILNYAQTGANRDLRIDSSLWTPSGVGRLRKYNWFDHTNILAELKTFPEAKNGFDYDIVLFADGRREWTPYHPAKGSFRANLVLEWGRNVVDFSYDKDGQDQGTKTYMSGASEGDVHFEQNYENVALSAKYRQRERVVSEGQEKDLPYLLDRAEEETAAFGNPVVLPDLTVRDIPASGGFPAIKLDGVLETGDVVPVRVNHGVCNMVGNYRITKIARQKNGRLKLTFNEDRAA